MIAILATAQMATDEEAVGLSRVHMNESKCILRDNCLLCTRLFILFLNILILLECTQSADNLFHSSRSSVRMKILQHITHSAPSLA